MNRFRRQGLSVFIPIMLAPLVMLAPVYLAGKALFWGTPLLQFVPWWAYAWQSLLDGHLPLWNSYVGMGAPLLANYQSALFYPPNWTYFLAYLIGGVKAVAWWQAPMLAFHLAWSGLGMALLVRRLSLGVLAQAVAGLAFGLSGYLVARASFLSINAAAAWLPWVILCLTPDNVAKRVSGIQQAPLNTVVSLPNLYPSHFLALVVCLSMQLLAGHAQTTWYTLLLAFLWVCFWQAERWHRLRRVAPGYQGVVQVKPGIIEHDRSDLRRRGIFASFVWFALALLLASGIAAAQLLPTAEYLAQSQRAAAIDFDYAMIYSFWPWRLLTLLVPGMFGSPVTGDYWGYGNYWEDVLYIGLLPCLLAIGAVVGAVRDSLRSWLHRSRGTNRETQQGVRQWIVSFACVICALGLLLALGNNTPVFPWLYHHVPTFDMFQAPARWLIWVEFALAILAALGAESWHRPEGWGLYWTRLGTAGAFSITLGAGYAWAIMGEVSPSFIRATALLGLWGLGAGLLSLAGPAREERPLDAPLEVSDLPLAAADSHSGSPVVIQDPQAGKAASNWRRRLFQLAPPAPTRHAPRRPYPLYAWQWAVTLFITADLLFAGWGLNPAGDLALYGPAQGGESLRAALGGHRLFFPPDQEYWFKYVRFLQFDTFNPGQDWNDLRAAMLANSNMLDGIPSVSNFDPLTPGRYADWLDLLGEVSLSTRQELLRLMDVGIEETLHRSLPRGLALRPLEGGARLRWVPCPRYAMDGADARRQVASERLSFDREVVLEMGVIAEAVECSPEAKANYIAIVLHDPNRLAVEVEADESGWLVLSDVWYPGWRARVDGAGVPILRANYLFRAVELPAGKHQVVFDYHPLWFYVGLVISLASIVFCFALVLLRLRYLSTPDRPMG